jgi:hypothetical protein
MVRIHCFAAMLLVCVFVGCVSGAEDPLAHMRASHPRLLVLDDQLAAVTSAVASDPIAASMHEQMRKEADRLLTVPPSVYIIGGPEHTLLSVSRTVEGRVFLLAGLYRLDHDRRFADRAIAEMRAAAGFPDWYPAHFLDTAEMTAALGIGYDWCFDAMSAPDRVAVKQAIIDKGIDPGIDRMQAGKSFSRLHNNWVQVCYGGLTLGALAIAEDEPARARQVIDHSIPAIQQIMKLFNPDGGFEEGPVYWNYATTFNTYYLAALNTALGMDVGWSTTFSYDKTGEYRMQTISPLFQYANFGDCDTKPGYAAQMFWMARQFNRPMYAEHERALDAHPDLIEKSPGIFELLWQFPLVKPASTTNTIATAESFARIHAAFMRTSWTDPNATYVAFKGGDARASHGHLDLGQFICEMAGQRWAVDLGSDSYGLPGYFGQQRFNYYRLGTEGHNTLTIGNANESKKSVATMALTQLADHTDIAIADLDRCYPESLTHWTRGLALRGNDRIVIQDELQPLGTQHIVWHFHTRATVKITGNNADLSQGGATVRLQIASPPNAAFSVVDASTPAAPNAANPGLSDVQIDLPAISQPTTITVELSQGSATATPLKVTSMDAWKTP